MVRYSPLRLRVFEGCLLRYRYQYVDRIPARLRPQDTAGSLVHRVLCDFFSRVPANERDSERLVKMFEDGWSALSPRYLRMPDVDQLRQRSLEELKLFAQRHDLAAEPFLVEPYFQVDVVPGVTLFGRVDRIDEEPDGSLHIIDYKTGSQPDEIDAGQLSLYAIMAEESLRRYVSRVSFWHLEDGTVWTSELSDEDKRATRSDLLVAVDRMNAVSEFPANVGPHCGHCPYLYACSARDVIQRRREAEGW
jgi:putative RecB family exonuclease